jgi:hypothetical protein
MPKRVSTKGAGSPQNPLSQADPTLHRIDRLTGGVYLASVNGRTPWGG